VVGPILQPAITTTVLNNNHLIFSGTNGPGSGTYRVLESTNLAAPRSGWTVIATDSFSGGSFAFTNVVDPSRPAGFYQLSVP